MTAKPRPLSGERMNAMARPPTRAATRPERWSQPRHTIRTGTGASRYSMAASGVPPNGRLADHVGQQAQEAGALDCLGELTLLLGRHGRDAGRNDLAALGDIAGQELRVLVVDLRRVRAGERAGLATTEERTATAAGCATSSTKC